MAQPTLIPNCDGARFESLPLDTPRNRCILALDLGTVGRAGPGLAGDGWARCFARALAGHGQYVGGRRHEHLLSSLFGGTRSTAPPTLSPVTASVSSRRQTPADSNQKP